MPIHGSSAWLEQPGEVLGWRRQSGDFRERTWEGPVSTLSTFLTTQLPGGFSEYSVRYDGELAVVTAKYDAVTTDPNTQPQPGETGLIERRWSLEGNDVEKSLWEHPDVQQALKGKNLDELIALRQFVDGVVSGEILASPANEAIGKLADRLVRGIEVFHDSEYVLRKEETVTHASNVRASHTNVNRVFTYSRLLASEPTLAAQNLIAAAGLTSLFWAKRTPKVRPTTGNLWVIEQEYWGAKEYDDWIWKPAQ